MDEFQDQQNGGTQRLISIVLDEKSIRRCNPNIDHEREVAIYDILNSNTFALEGRDDGPYKLTLGIIDDRLVFSVGNTKVDHNRHPRTVAVAATAVDQRLLHRLRELLQRDPLCAALTHSVDRHGTSRSAR